MSIYIIGRGARAKEDLGVRLVCSIFTSPSRSHLLHDSQSVSSISQTSAIMAPKYHPGETVRYKPVGGELHLSLPFIAIDLRSAVSCVQVY